MSAGFRVDLHALRSAASGIEDTVDEMATKRVKDLDPSKSDFGHDALAGTVSDFCERWDIGVGHLAEDAKAIAVSLRSAATIYENTDEAIRDGIDGYLVQAYGVDPAAR